jgi:hypothetical protein
VVSQELGTGNSDPDPKRQKFGIENIFIQDHRHFSSTFEDQLNQCFTNIYKPWFDGITDSEKNNYAQSCWQGPRSIEWGGHCVIAPLIEMILELGPSPLLSYDHNRLHSFQCVRQYFEDIIHFSLKERTRNIFIQVCLCCLCKYKTFREKESKVKSSFIHCWVASFSFYYECCYEEHDRATKKYISSQRTKKNSNVLLLLLPPFLLTGVSSQCQHEERMFK